MTTDPCSCNSLICPSSPTSEICTCHSFCLQWSCSHASSFTTPVFYWLASTHQIRWALLPSESLSWPLIHSTCSRNYQETYFLFLLGTTFPSLPRGYHGHMATMGLAQNNVPRAAPCFPLPWLRPYKQGNTGSPEMKMAESIYGRILVSEPPLAGKFLADEEYLFWTLHDWGASLITYHCSWPMLIHCILWGTSLSFTLSWQILGRSLYTT